MNLEQEIQDFQKSEQDHINDQIITPIENYIIEKGVKANIGDIRNYSGIDYVKISSTGNANKDWVRAGGKKDTSKKGVTPSDGKVGEDKDGNPLSIGDEFNFEQKFSNGRIKNTKGEVTGKDDLGNIKAKLEGVEREQSGFPKSSLTKLNKTTPSEPSKPETQPSKPEVKKEDNKYKLK